MVQRGHAENCPACQHAELPEVDQQWFAEHSYVPEHIRRPAPVDPGFPITRWNRCAVLVFVGSLAGCFLTAYSLLIFLAFVVVLCVDRPVHAFRHAGAGHRWCRWCLEQIPRDYITAHEAWKREQLPG